MEQCWEGKVGRYIKAKTGNYESGSADGCCCALFREMLMRITDVSVKACEK